MPQRERRYYLNGFFRCFLYRGVCDTAAAKHDGGGGFGEDHRAVVGKDDVFIVFEEGEEGLKTEVGRPERIEKPRKEFTEIL